MVDFLLGLRNIPKALPRASAVSVKQRQGRDRPRGAARFREPPTISPVSPRWFPAGLFSSHVPQSCFCTFKNFRNFTSYSHQIMVHSNLWLDFCCFNPQLSLVQSVSSASRQLTHHVLSAWSEGIQRQSAMGFKVKSNRRNPKRNYIAIYK